MEEVTARWSIAIGVSAGCLLIFSGCVTTTECTGGRVRVDGTCVCPTGLTEDGEGVCRACVDPKRVFNEDTKRCDCPSDKNDVAGVCTCPTGLKDDDDGVCRACVDDVRVYNDDTNTCDCPSDKNDVGGSCVCPPRVIPDGAGVCQACEPGREFVAQTRSCDCPAGTTEIAAACICDDPLATFNTSTGACDCNEGTVLQGNACACEGLNKLAMGNMCVCPTDATEDMAGDCMCPEGRVLNGAGDACVCAPGFALVDGECLCEPLHFEDIDACPDCLLDYRTDGTFARSSVATMWDEPTQCFRVYEPDEPRLYKSGTLYVEEPRSNRLGASSTLDDASNEATAGQLGEFWSASSVALASRIQSSTGPFPTDAIAVRWDASDEQVRYSVNVGQQREHALSFFFQHDTAQFQPQVVLFWEDGGATVTGPTGDPNNGWQRASVQTSLQWSGPWGALAQGVVPGVVNASRFQAPQAERGSFPTQFMPAIDDQAGRRDPEVMTFGTVAAGTLRQSEWELEVWPAMSNQAALRSFATPPMVIFAFEAPPEQVGVSLREVAGQMRLCIGDINLSTGSDACTAELAWQAGDLLELAIDATLANPSVTLTIGGMATGPVISPKAFPTGVMRVGAGSVDTNFFSGFISRPHLPR